MRHKIIYTADLHGNEIQYQKLVNYALITSTNSVIIGGDIAPKGIPDDEFIEVQRNFLKKELLRILAPLKEKSPETKVYLMMGNDDCAVNLGVLEKGEPEFYHLIHNKRLKLTADFEIVGYSYVPMTPFGI